MKTQFDFLAKMFPRAPILAIAIVVVGVVPSAFADKLKCYDLDMSYRQILLDDFVVDTYTAHNVEKVYHQAKSFGQSVLEATFAYEKDWHRLDNPCVWWDPVEKKYRMWYWGLIRTRDQDGRARWKSPIGYAESDDGLNWQKPILGNVEYNGDGGKNNIVTDEFMTPQALPLPEPDAEGNRIRFYEQHTYRMMGSKDGRTPGKIVQLKLPPFPNEEFYRRMVGRGAPKDGGRWMWDPQEQVYRMSVKLQGLVPGSQNPNQFRRILGLASSNDGIEWQWAHFPLMPDLKDDEFVSRLPERKNKSVPAHAEFEQMAMFRYQGVVIGYANTLYFYDEYITKHNSGANTGVHLVWSRDGVNWQRPTERYQLFPTPIGTPYWGMCKGAGSLPPLRMGKELWIYRDVAEGGTNNLYKPPKQKWLTLSTLRTDGWAGYRAGNQWGHITTQFLKADGKLRVNADCTDGEMRIEVIEAGERRAYFRPRKEVIPGFSKDDCLPITGDVYDAEINWSDAKWSTLNGKWVALRIHLKNATIYSFRTNGESPVQWDSGQSARAE